MKVEIIEEMDGDYGPILRVHVAGEKQSPFTIAKHENARETVLKATIATLQKKVDVLEENTRELYAIRGSIRSILKFAGVL